MNCPKCGVTVAMPEIIGDDAQVKLDEHNLWHHPTQEQINDCYAHLMFLFGELREAHCEKDTIGEAMIISDLMKEVMRYRRYMLNSM